MRNLPLESEETELTESEIKQGWHFCCEFDGLLVGPDMTEQQFCTCPGVSGSDENNSTKRQPKPLGLTSTTHEHT